MLDTAEETIIDYITCPKCKDYIQPPSHCCENGHFICHKCKKKVKICPVCKVENYPNKKNTIFDMILKEMYYPCGNQENGCPGYFKYEEIKEHQQVCEYQLLPCTFQSAGCPLKFKLNEKSEHEQQCHFGVSCRIFFKLKGTVQEVCHWRGFKNQLHEHILSNHQRIWHPQIIEINVAFAWMLPLDMNFEKVELIQLKDTEEMFYFYVRSESHGNQSVAIQHIGHHEKSKDYLFSVEFMHETKRVKYENCVIPLSSEAEDVYRSNNGFEIHYAFLKKHFLAERVIDCYVKIFKKNKGVLQGRKSIRYSSSILVDEQHK